MGNNLLQQQHKQDGCAQDTLPPWAKPIIRVSGIIYPIFLVITALLLVACFVFLAINQLHFSLVRNLIGAMAFFGTLGIITLLVAEYRSVIPSWCSLGVGLALFYSPLLITMIANKVGVAETDKVLISFNSTSSNLGAIAVVLSIMSLMAQYAWAFLIRDKQWRAARIKYLSLTTKTNHKPGLIPTCWQMSRCRPHVRTTCPNYLERTACWKKRSGCFCDRDLANYLVQNVGRGEADEVMAVQRYGTTQRNAEEKKRRPSWKEQKLRCFSCPLYLEHQEYKHRNFRWVSFVATAAIVAGAWQFFHAGYTFSVQYLNNTLIEHSLKIPGVSLTESLANSPFEYILVGVLSLLLLSYVIALVDKFFLDWKL